MSKFNLLLASALLASCLALVRTSYEARRLFSGLDQARAEQKRLDAEYKRVDAERQAQATHLRVEKVAREKLAMRPATPGVTTYVNDGADASPAPLPAAPDNVPPPPSAAPEHAQLAARTPLRSGGLR